MPVGDRIKAYRDKKGLSQSDLAKKAQISQGSLSRIEANQREPNVKSLVRIAKALRVSTEELTQGDANPTIVDGNQEIKTVSSNFIDELRQLEGQLTPQQRKIIIRIARALTLETITKKNGKDKEIE